MNIVNRRCIRIFTNSITRLNYCSDKKVSTFKSAYSLDKLYPESKQELYTPNFVPEDPEAKFNGYIPLKELQIKYSCSGGPGGQHVNTTSTKVDLRFKVETANWLSPEIRDKLLELHKNKINKDGYLIVKSDLTRSQQLNTADAMEKLRKIIREAAKPEAQMSPETEELLRKRRLNASRQRLFEKRKRSEIKSYRNEKINF